MNEEQNRHLTDKDKVSDPWRTLGHMITLAGRRGHWAIFRVLTDLLLGWVGWE